MAASTVWGSQFSINTTTKGSQRDVSLQYLKDGSFVAVWADNSETGGDTSGSSIRAQIFNADGSKRGGEFLVNNMTEGSQSSPEIAVLNDGRFVVAWKGYDNNGNYVVKARVYQADGNPSGSEFQVNTASFDGNELSITALSNGGFAVAFVDENSDLRVQSFTASLERNGSEVIAYDSAGSVYNPVIIGMEGQYAVYFEGSGGVRGRILNNDGSAPGASPDFVLSNQNNEAYSVRSAKLVDGRQVVTWLEGDYSGPSDTYLIKAQIFNANGSKAGTELVLKSFSEAAGIASVGHLDVTQLIDGGFAISYSTRQEDATAMELHLASFNSNGASAGGDLVVSRQYISNSTSLETLADGRIVISWDDYVSPDLFEAGLNAQIIDPRQKSVNLTGSQIDDTFIGTSFNDVLNGGLGRDVLTGGDGKDTFVFNTAVAKKGNTNVDIITDFNANKTDRIYLENSIFKGLGKKGSLKKPVKLDKDAFWIGSKAHDKEDRVIYNKKTGDLSYDADGSGKGKAIVIAKLEKNLKYLDAGDFFVI